MSKFVDWIIARAKKTPYFHLTRSDGSVYMRRWWLLPYNWTGIAVRIHEIVQSDEDRHPHDHPWWYLSIILKGGYWEITPCPECDGHEEWRGCLVCNGELEFKEWYGPGSVLLRRASHFHRLELKTVRGYVREDTGIEVLTSVCTTLFISFPKIQSWGFLVEGQKVSARDYLLDRFVDTKYRGD